MKEVFAYVIGLGAAVMMPVIFTILGALIGIKFSKALKSGLLVGVGFVLTFYSINWLWLSIAGLAINWYGDSLDGTLARYRNTQRPIYGYYVDHTVDCINEAMMFTGAGLSAFMHLPLALFLFIIYLMLTIGCGICYYLAGMGLFDCLNYSMTTTATGGFATHNASTGYFHNPYIDYTAIAFMFLSGTSFVLLYSLLFKGRIKQFFKNAEFKFYVMVVLIAATAVTIILVFDNNYKVLDAIRVSLFQVMSFITTTGIFNDDAAQWHHITWVILTICMFCGACSGSTSGGFKCIRSVMLVNILRNEIKRILHPRAVLPVKVNETTIPYSSQVTLLAFLAAYMCLCLFTYFIMIVTGVDSTNSITIAISCASNVGPTLGLEIGPTMSWSILPSVVKWLLSALMLMGRLEIFSVIVLFSPSFWKDN